MSLHSIWFCNVCKHDLPCYASDDEPSDCDGTAVWKRLPSQDWPRGLRALLIEACETAHWEAEE